MLTDYLDWTEAQWKEYAERHVTITLEELGRFLTACELLGDGARLNSLDERGVWKDIIVEFFPLYVQNIQEISNLKVE